MCRNFHRRAKSPIQEAGWKIVAIIYVSGGVYSEDGLHAEGILGFFRADRGRTLADYAEPNLTRLSNEELLSLQGDDTFRLISG